MKRAASLCLLTVLIAGAVLAGVGSAASDPGWGAAVSLESNNLDAVFPQVAVDPRGNAIAVWRQFDGNIDNLTANRYVAGLGWTGEVLIEAEDAGGATQPQIALDPQGNAIVVWRQSNGTRDSIMANGYVAGVAWGAPVYVETDDAGNAAYPQVDADTAGNAVAVWHQSDGTRTNIWANRYAVGAGWGPAQLVETLDLGDAEYPDVAMDAAGNALAGWYQFDGTRFDVWANRFVASEGWGSAERIENGADNAFGPALAMDRSGNGVAVFTQFDGTVFNAWANRYAVGSGWGTPVLLENQPGGPIALDVAMDAFGNAVAVWHQFDGTRTNIWSNRYAVGTSWGAETVVEIDVASARNPQVALDADGNAMAVWSSGPVGSIWASRYAVADSDGDGLSDLAERHVYGTNPNDADTDRDALPDGDEIRLHGTSPVDPDSDNDGLRDAEEVFVTRTDPTDPDSDGGGLPDGWEVDNGLDPSNGLDDQADSDVDGLTNLREYEIGTNPRRSDTDGDGVPDGQDVFPLNLFEYADYDGDGIGDNGDPDIDGDGVFNAQDAFPFDPNRGQEDTLRSDAASALVLPVYLLVALVLLMLVFQVLRTVRRPPAPPQP